MDGNPHAPPPQGGAFQDGVAAMLMATEELRQTLMEEEITSQRCLQVRHRMEEVVGILFSLRPNDEVERDLKAHCHSKAAAVALEAMDFVTAKPENPEKHIPDVEREVQGAVARMVELSLILYDKKDSSQEEIIKTYTAYQRKVVRERVTPTMKELVARRQWKSQHAETWAHRAEEEEDDDDDNAQHQKATHSSVITTILSQASALVHPLIMWKSQLPRQTEAPTPIPTLCDSAVGIVDKQAQTLTQTVATWYTEDKRVDAFWMGKSADDTHCTPDELSELDTLVDELAFLCQIFDRYIALMASEKVEDTPTTICDLHAEWTWKYASLERYLTSQHMLSALQLAHPVQIVLGTSIQVPSVVEDAQYLSTRALERAASARSAQAIGTVAHAVASNVWSTDSSVTGGVHQALVDQKGCYKDENDDSAAQSAKSPTGSTPNSNSFASALMGALDEDLASSPARANARPPAAPSSGSFLGIGSLSSSIVGGDNFKRIRMDTYFCALNGAHSASAACLALVQFLDSLLAEGDAADDEKSSTMIQLAREELFRFSKEYQFFLKTKASDIVSEFCGKVSDAPVYRGDYVFPVLRYYLERENYDIPTADVLQAAEDDVRITQKLLQPLQSSVFLGRLSRCDADVMVVLYGEVASRLVDLFFQVLLSETIPKPFTDWGALLLSKEVRMLQNLISKSIENISDKTISMMPQWERLSQAVTVLQLEKPSDWTFYQASSKLSPSELEAFLRLRKDFSKDAVGAIVASSKASSHPSTC